MDMGSKGDMPLFRRQACFNSWTTKQKTMQIDDTLLIEVGQSFIFHERNYCVTVYIFLIVKTFCIFICDCNTINKIACPRLNIKEPKNKGCK
jgi:hypothetical protein